MARGGRSGSQSDLHQSIIPRIHRTSPPTGPSGASRRVHRHGSDFTDSLLAALAVDFREGGRQRPHCFANFAHAVVEHC